MGCKTYFYWDSLHHAKSRNSMTTVHVFMLGICVAMRYSMIFHSMIVKTLIYQLHMYRIELEEFAKGLNVI